MWIGFGVIILSGVTIGQGAVIGAGSVVAKDVPPYAVYAGNEVKKYRFPDSIITKLLSIDLSSIDYDDAANCFDTLYTSVTESNLDQIIETLHLKTKAR